MAHSKFSASGAERWLNCTGSVAMEDGIEEQQSPYASEGTAAHLEAERLLFEAPLIGEDKNEMQKGAEIYRDFIHSTIKGSKRFTLAIEEKLQLKWIDPELYGTADCVIEDHTNKVIHIIDYKFGKKKVDPNCAQLKYYAVGVVHKYKPAYRMENIKHVYLTVVQPRIKQCVNTYDVSHKELGDFSVRLQRTVKAIKLNRTDLVPGSYCWFCKAKNVCRAYRDKYVGSAQSDFDIIN